MTGYTDLDKLTEIERELRYRRRLYPGLKARGDSAVLLDRQIAIMEAIAEDYRLLVGQMKLPI